MMRSKKISGGDPVEAWIQRHGITVSALRHQVNVALPGGILSLRTNSSGFSAYLRRRCRYLPAAVGSKVDSVAEVFCLPGQRWPVVSPHDEPERTRRYKVDTEFRSFCKDGVICAWRPPALMGCITGKRPAMIRIIATTMTLRLRCLPCLSPDAFQGKCESARIPYPDIFDLMLCLFARARGGVILHGAVLEKNGCGILLTGESGCGKTTSALALVRGGFRLLTDEYAVLWKCGLHRGKIGGVLVPQRIAGKPPTSLDELEKNMGTVAEKTEFSVGPSATRLAPVTVKAVLSLVKTKRRSCEHRAVPMEPQELLLRLMSQLLDPVSIGRHDILETLVDMMGNTRAYQVAAGTNLASLPAFVEELLSGRNGTSRKRGVT